ncbi:hypothetical protein ACROYT_G012383 [Oculina patagonica]
MQTRHMGNSLQNRSAAAGIAINVVFTSYCTAENIKYLFPYLHYGMEEPKNKYILLHDRVGYTLERSLLALGLSKTSTPTNVLRGELLEAIPEAEQPADLTRIAVVGIERKALHLQCRTEDLTRLPDEDANLLLAISSLELRYQTFIDRKHPGFGRRLLLGNQVFVSGNGISKDVPGVVWYKGKAARRPPAANVAAGKSKQTDTSTFITQRACKIFGKAKSSKPSGRKGDQDVAVQHDEGTVYTGKDPSGDLPRQLREMEHHSTNVQGQLREKELQEAKLQVQLREKEQQEENSQRQLRELEQQLARMQQQLRETDRELENSERLSREREQQLAEKDLQEALLHEQLREKEQQLRERDEHGETLQRQLRELEQQGSRMEGQLREKDAEKENFQRQQRELEQQLTISQRHLIDQEQESAHLQQQVLTLEEQLRAKHQEMNEMETTLSTAQQALTEQQLQQTPDWVISRDQIQLTDKLLGRGGWGSVVEGKYCGCAVAVKQIHELILSAYNQILFEREMDIASRCRHPCLLQFIGATNDEGSPLFVTELMESSLRVLLEQRPLSVTEVSIISLDVARGLSYLHQKTPSPIIHRDISSANVLLWRQGDQWRGKVSDYGTANFMQHTMTVAPGAMIYIAPEALTAYQTVKVSYDKNSETYN